MGGWLHNYVDALPRVTLGLVFVLWGLDKVISPTKYVSWISVTWRIRMLIPQFMSIESFVYLLSLVEVILGLSMLVGIYLKYSSILISILLIFFLLLAGPPMSYPQDIALLGVSLWVYSRGGDRFTLDYRRSPK